MGLGMDENLFDCESCNAERYFDREEQVMYLLHDSNCPELAERLLVAA